MLKIKNNKWEEFKKRRTEFGFEINDLNNAFVRKFYQEEAYPNDYFSLQILFSNQEIFIETSNVRYGGFSTDGTELVVLYDLIMNDFIEKIEE